MTFRIDIEDGELVDGLTSELTGRGVGDAALVLVGGVDAFTVSTMPAGDAAADVVTAYEQPGELTGTGEWRDGTLHVHAVCGIEGDVSRAGHLHAAEVRTHFVHVYVSPVERAPRPRTGKWSA